MYLFHHFMNRGSESRTKVPRLRTRLRLVTSEAILTAAEAAIAERGLHAAGMVEIAERAGVSVGTLYNHFRDKDALVAALIEGRRRELAMRIDLALGPLDDAPFGVQLGAFVEALAAHFEDHRRFLQMIWDEESARGTPVARREGSPIADVRTRLDRLMKLGVREGALRKDGAGLFAAALMGMAKGVFMADKRPGKRAATAGALLALFLQGAAAR